MKAETNHIKFREYIKWSGKSRVASSNPRVTSLKSRVATSNPRVARSNPRVRESLCQGKFK